MENDLILKHFLNNDNKLNKIEMKLSLDFLKCKLENCYSNGKVDKFSHEDYEDCKEKCMKKLTQLNLMKSFLYKDFTRFYYERFLSCSNELDDSIYTQCLDDTKKSMKRNVEDIKHILMKSFKV